MMKSICVFCSSSDLIDEVYFKTAIDLGCQIGGLNLDLVYGGGGIGLMGAVARSVHKNGGKVVGVFPEFLREKDKGFEYTEADELIIAETMRIRKAIMDERADAFIVLPGGIGTLEEAIEIMSMKQLGLTEKPLAFVNTNNFYDGLVSNFQMMVGLKFAKSSILDLFAVCPNPSSALEFILSYKSKKKDNKWL
ncbi:MAG: TIGR00730 family Rossman fold protein [Nitrospina sp.]|nr:TIGR00730 family Rossman fold protein [Nitrospina sp.]MBT6661857.1 TIGR00730 family Rossman fold protein [Nitrospina sp.]